MVGNRIVDGTGNDSVNWAYMIVCRNGYEYTVGRLDSGRCNAARALP